MENQMAKKMGNEMDTGILILGLLLRPVKRHGI